MPEGRLCNAYGMAAQDLPVDFWVEFKVLLRVFKNQKDFHFDQMVAFCWDRLPVPGARTYRALNWNVLPAEFRFG